MKYIKVDNSKLKPIKCIQCKKHFQPSTKHRKLCSVECKKRIAYLRQRYRRKKFGYENIDPVLRVISSAKRRAKNYGIPFNLRKEDLFFPKRCPILKIIMAFNKGRAKVNSFSLDRLVPEKGYVKGNVRVISYRANGLKNNLTLTQAKRIVKYMKGEI